MKNSELIGSLVLNGYTVSYDEPTCAVNIHAANGDPYMAVDLFDRTLSIEGGQAIPYMNIFDLLEEMEKAA